ncbi:TonB-dependent receptor [Phenylobacterium sp. SCN 70-31]|uniref:TonB-dependent receptor n=1 Tax=Phenylobacterium sp. SCN 70-31 TaxID=1660129 RepID=UPI00086BA7F4|nr:TonB-dependent receptor [Phenylobacterium sp. SCN 70-31]ODT88349.1 MAG: hypothetical protein ABS78_06945 [Phenylobacterium sp. SCN 70-31]
MKAGALFLSTAVVACLSGLNAANAQDGGNQIEEIVVTARKVAEPLQEVPLSISALSSRDIERQGIREPSDLSSIVPGLTYEKDFGRRNERPVIRGQSNVLGVPNVSFFIDGVFIPNSLMSTDLAFVDRVEVIKGPQSALYGRQSFAGAISYVSKDPSPTWQRRVRLTGGSYDYFDATVSASGPIRDDLGIQLTANYYTFGGEYRNNAPGRPSHRLKLGTEETVAGSIALKYTGVQNLTTTFRAAVAVNDDGAETVGMQRGALNNCFMNTRTRYYCGPIVVTPDDITLSLDLMPEHGIERRQMRSSLTNEYAIGDYTATSITGFTRAYESRKSDLDYLPVAASNLHVDDAWQTQSFSQELRLASPGDDRLHWLIGAYYYNAYTKYSRYFYNTNALQLNGTTKTINYAAFGLMRYKITDQISASAEIRYGVDDLSLVGGANRYDLGAKYKSWNPRFTLDYQITSDVLLYASAAKGNKPGGFNSDVRLAANQRTYGEEKSWQYEAGMKSDFFDKRLRLNASMYYIDWSGQQLTQSTLLQGGATTVSLIRNVGDLDVKGAEFEAQAAVHPNITLRGSASVADSEYTSGTDPEIQGLTGSADITGKTSPNAPKYTAAFGVYAFTDTSMGRLYIDADYSYRSKKYDQVANFAWVKGRGVTNVRLGAELDAVTAVFAVTNVFNNKDPITATRYSDFLTVGPLRSFLGAIPPGRRFSLSLEKTW